MRLPYIPGPLLFVDRVKYVNLTFNIFSITRYLLTRWVEHTYDRRSSIHLWRV
jgi:hypothetical protein